MALVRDALRLLGVLVTYRVSGRPVRPLADEAMRPLPGDELVAGAKIRWSHAITIRAHPVVRVAEPDRALVPGDDAGQMSWAFPLEPAGETSTRLITRSRGPIDRPALGLLLKVFWHPLDFGMQRRQLLNLKRLVETP